MGHFQAVDVGFIIFMICQ